MNHATSSLNWNSCRILSSKRIIPVILVISSIYLDHDEVPVLIKNCSWGKFEHLETHFIYSVTWKHNENIPNGILSLPDHLSVANFSIIARFLKRTPRSILQIQKRRRITEYFNSITQKSKIKKYIKSIVLVGFLQRISITVFFILFYIFRVLYYSVHSKQICWIVTKSFYINFNFVPADN